MSSFAPVSSGAQVLPDEEEGSIEGIETNHVDDSLINPAGDDTGTSTAAPEPKNENDDDDLPEPLRGKSVKELAKMYAEAQKLIGRQGQELGEVRRLADSAIRASLAAKQAPAEPKPAPKQLDEADIFARPREAIDQLIAEHPEVKAAKQSAAELQQERVRIGRLSAKAAFEEAHPDAGEILADPAFAEWVGKSKVRAALLKRAHVAYDFESGNELFSTWKELNAAKKAAAAPAREAKETARKEKLKAAAVPSGNSAPASSGQKKIFRRADILKLMENDPERYEALSAEIQKAYEEGRVR